MLNNHQPGIVKYIQSSRAGLQSRTYSRYGIGYVLKGTKHIFLGDIRHEVRQGELFYLGAGSHYTEEVPDNGKPYEELVFFYTPENLNGILSNLNSVYGLDIVHDHWCANCHNKSVISFKAWNAVNHLFASIDQHIKDNIFEQDCIMERMKAMELIYLIISNPDCCIKCKILDITDLDVGNFERTIKKHIFDDCSIEELADICNKSLTTFKKEFKQQFHETPHRWIIKQRLMHSRLLLNSTNKSISEIGVECRFPNTSHFIKLFKQEYGHTPALYRALIRGEKTTQRVEESRVPVEQIR